MRTLLHAPHSKRRSIAAATLGALALVGSLLVATPAQALGDTGTGGVFTSASGRIFDTKSGIGGYTTAMPANTYRSVPVAGSAGIPSNGTAGAVSVIVTVSEASASGAVLGRPSANADETVLGFYGADKASFPAVLAIGADGAIRVKSQSSVRMSIDVQGYYTSNVDGTAPGGFVPLSGARVVDTRSGLGTTQGVVADGSTRTVQITGTAGVPAGASAAIVNLIAANTTSTAGYFTPYAAGTTRPGTVLSYGASGNTAIQAQVPLSADGKITIYNRSSTPNLIVDVQGYFTASNGGGSVFTPGTGRVFDSRASGTAILSGNETRAITVAGRAGVPVMSSGLTAVVFTLTAVNAGSAGRAIVWANGTKRPETTALNFDQGTAHSNTVTAPLGANGKISLLNYASATDYVIDVQGWYANPTAPTVSCPNYEAGSWSATIPDQAISCTVTAPARAGGSGTIEVTVDSDPVTFQRSDTGATSVNVLVDNLPGQHTITARDISGTASNTSGSYGFGLGDWATKTVTADPATGSTVSLNPELSVYVLDDDIPADAAIVYAVKNSAGTIVATSPSVNDSWNVPAGVLTNGAAYTWQATITGASGGREDLSTVTTPWYSFTADETVSDEAEFSNETDDATVTWGPGSEVVSADAAGARVPLGDGTALTLPADAVLTETSAMYHVVYGNGYITDVSKATSSSVGVARAASSYYPKISFYFSRAQVESAYKMMKKYNEICGAPGVGWVVGWACTHSNASLQEALTKAHYQKKRIRHDFYRSKVCGSCSRNVYVVVK
ncbi:hypothetical protein [Curtobacterium sp. MCBA15_005]|uniref:hypothetical protein n=1 Tax=Curtobacterium sp. MCBA15_005 TaxID=1898734 RepID=UPI000AAD0391|nr:hypothetical protein [Curtobacterium sp. MCBA15_005]